MLSGDETNGISAYTLQTAKYDKDQHDQQHQPQGSLLHLGLRHRGCGRYRDRLSGRRAVDVE